MKRKAPQVPESESEGYSEVPLSEGSDEDEDLDISAALLGGASKPRQSDALAVDDGDDAQFIKSQIMKSNVKGGMEVLKKVKGKGNLPKGAVGGGSFQSMGLHPSLLRALLLRGYRTPTPIQRLSIPSLLSSPPRDLVGMARTGSGKTLAYMVPLIQRLGGQHRTAYGARALILVPARELALQIMKVGKEMARGWGGASGTHAGDLELDEESGVPNGKSQSLRWGLIVGGEGLDEQFEMISNNPDVIIATPGRLLHLIVEMNLDLRSVQYVVFDEADRLFEMGFSTALHEILHRLPATRQTLLFSATLPKNLVDFAKAGLQDPKLVRLDSETKISSDLRMAFFSVKQAEKDACLLTLLRDTIRVPFASERAQDEKTEERKRKGKTKEGEVRLAPHQTLIFTATKHHVEYLSSLLTTAGYAVSHIYGSLDQVARTMQMDRFRQNVTDVLVVTDVAARGIDIPVLEHVVNYDYPQGARVFVHRVGRTARAGRSGWAWSFINNAELPHLLDLQLFLGKELKTRVPLEESAFTDSLVLGTFPRDRLDEEVEYVKSLDDANSSLQTLREVMRKGQGLYERTMTKAGPPSYKRAKEMVKEGKWGLAGSAEEGTQVHPAILLKSKDAASKGITASAENAAERRRQQMLLAVNLFQPAETVFEIGNRGKTPAAALMKDRRKALSKAVTRAPVPKPNPQISEDDETIDTEMQQLELADEAELETVFGTHKNGESKRGYRDSEFYMSHYQKDADTEKGYSLNNGTSFAQQARTATFDLVGDDGRLTGRQRHGKQLNWDKKKKKFVQGAGEGADNVKMVRTESGAKLPASYRSGKFDEWQAKTRVSLPKVGEAELPSRGNSGRSGGGFGANKRFKHNKTFEAKALDPRNVGYERKSRQLQKQNEKAGAMPNDEGKNTRFGGRAGGKQGARPGASHPKKGTRFGGKPIGKVKSELKTVDAIRKARNMKEKRRAKNARPSKKGRR